MSISHGYKLYKKVQTKTLTLMSAVVLAVTGIGGGLPLLLQQSANAIGSPAVVYNALPSVSPQTNYPSQPFQAQQTDEFGDYVHLAGTNRTLDTVTVTMSDWAKFSDYSSNPTYNTNSSYWTYPITLNVYGNSLDANGAPSDLIGTVTQNINIPWRPESDPTCGPTSNGNGWKTGGVCYDYSGLAFNATFDLSSLNAVLPNDVIIGVALNTQSWGYSPTGVAGPYNSLNVAIPSGQTASVGSDDSSDSVFWNTHTCGYYTAPGTCNVFRADTNWTPYGTVALEVTATPVDTSSTVFVSTPKYVRANNGGDLDAQIVTPDSTQNVRFYLDGDTGTPFYGTDIGGAGATTSWWRLYTPLPAGQHTISAQIEISGNWYDIASTGTVYSIDAPWAQYVIPSANQYFRPNDKVVRVKADDEFDQFDRMVTTINGVSHTVSRSSCTDAGSYVLCDLQNLNLPAGTYTASTTTYTKANNRVDNLVSPSFTIDNSAPILTNFQITHTQAVYGSSVDVSADATDDNGIQNVTFYVTAPRAGDGVCDGNGSHLASATGTLSGGSTYTASLDTSSLNGDYCLNAIAGDVAANHSTISHIKATFDNIAPVVDITNPGDGSLLSYVHDGAVDIRGSVNDSNPDHYYIHVYGPGFNYSKTVYDSNPFTNQHLYSWNLHGLSDGSYTIDLEAKDAAGNKDNSVSVKKIHVTVDNTSPNVTLSTTPSGFVNGTIAVNGSVSDVNGLADYNLSLYPGSTDLSDGGTHTGARIAVSTSGWGTTYTSATSATISTSLDTSSLATGAYQIRLAARDAAGNDDTHSVKVVTIHVDNTNPTITLSSLAAAIHGTVTLTGTAFDNASGDSGLRYSNTDTTSGSRVRISFRPIVGGIAGAPVHTYFANVDGSGNWTLDVDTTDSWFVDGQEYRIVARANDNVGATYSDSNTASVTANTTIDNTAPTLTIGSYSGDDTTPTITGTTSDATDTVTVDGNPAAVSSVLNGSGSYDWSYTPTVAFSVGSHTITAVSTDLAGNATTQTATVTVTSPVIALVGGLGGGGGTTVTVSPNNTGNGGDGQVLGVSTDSANNGQVKSDTVDLTNQDNGGNKNSGSDNFLGLGWWWLLVLAIVLGGLWWFLLARRSDSDN
jgi:hypothetical protein